MKSNLGRRGGKQTNDKLATKAEISKIKQAGNLEKWSERTSINRILHYLKSITSTAASTTSSSELTLVVNYPVTRSRVRLSIWGNPVILR